MHEAGLIGAALAGALAATPGAGALELRIRDPVRVGADAARLHLELALRARGLEGLPIAVRVEPVHCPSCEAENRPDPGSPFCSACGWPLPRRAGPGLEIRARS